ncbi:synaptonemal complex central element protein 3 [Brachyhypopomus gauderio]|uniref:synaptonemal complex central element protein 3 n=1 Tax=Brachyhypopomus gauderio TaxID=698409 RepID=UPI0040424B08
MVDSGSTGELHEDFDRENLQLNKDLESMTEQMENISVNLTWMAYDMVALRTDPQTKKSLKRLEDEYLLCKAVICGSAKMKNLDAHSTLVHQTPTQE